MPSQKFSEPLNDVLGAYLSGLTLLSAWPLLVDGSRSNCKQASICLCNTHPSSRLPWGARRAWGEAWEAMILRPIDVCVYSALQEGQQHRPSLGPVLCPNGFAKVHLQIS